MRLYKKIAYTTSAVLLCGGVVVPVSVAASTDGIAGYSIAESANADQNNLTNQDRQKIENVLVSLVATQDQVRKSGSLITTRMQSASLTNSEAVADAVSTRDTFSAAGLEIIDSKTDVVILDARSRGAQTLVDAEITTGVVSTTQDRETINSGWSDKHSFVIEMIGTEARVVSSEISNDYGVDNVDDAEGVTNPEPGSEASTDVNGAVEEPWVGMRSNSSFSVVRFGEYAQKYTERGSRYADVPQGNPDYPKPKEGSNCANFASQTLHAAGWTLKNGVRPTDLNNWHYNLTGPATFSRSWSQASSLYAYARAKKGWSKIKNLHNTKVGDLIFADWDPDGAADGKIDHVMVVSKRTRNSPPMISQKSPNRHNVPISEQIRRAEKGKKSIVWYALRHK